MSAATQGKRWLSSHRGSTDSAILVENARATQRKGCTTPQRLTTNAADIFDLEGMDQWTTVCWPAQWGFPHDRCFRRTPRAERQSNSSSFNFIRAFASGEPTLQRKGRFGARTFDLRMEYLIRNSPIPPSAIGWTGHLGREFSLQTDHP